MSHPFRPIRLQHVVAIGDPLDALVYAQNVFAAVDRHMPEARGLATWLSNNALAFGLDDPVIPNEGAGSRRSRQHTLSVEDWLKVGEALDVALTTPTRGPEMPTARWIAELSRMLQLDVLSSRILALALHYKFDQRVEGLLDVISECRGASRRLSRDAGLLALLLQAPSSAIARSLTPSAKLLASGLLQLNRFGSLEVQDRLVSLIRQDIPPAADCYDQLLGSSRPESLPWDAFAQVLLRTPKRVEPAPWRG